MRNRVVDDVEMKDLLHIYHQGRLHRVSTYRNMGVTNFMYIKYKEHRM